MARDCSVALALEVVGDRWSLLVVREVLLGVRRFDAIQEATGAPRAVLAQRLRTLVDTGVLRTEAYREAGARERREYHLTAAGQDLQTVVTALRDWGDRHHRLEDPPLVLVHATSPEGSCGAPVHAALRCGAGHDVRSREVVPSDGTGTTDLPSTGRTGRVGP